MSEQANEKPELESSTEGFSEFFSADLRIFGLMEC